MLMSAPEAVAAVAPAAKSGRRLQFGLGTLLLVILFVSMGILWLSAQADVRRLKEENKSLRNELGQIVVEDETLVHVRSVKKDGEGWRWRLYLPVEAVYKVEMTTQGIGDAGDGIAMGSSQIHFPAGQFMVDVLPERDLKGNWDVRFKHSTGAFSIGCGTEPPKFMNGNNMIDGIGSGTLTFDNDATIELMRLRAMVPRGNGYVAPAGPGDGLLVRMKRVK